MHPKYGFTERNNLCMTASPTPVSSLRADSQIVEVKRDDPAAPIRQDHLAPISFVSFMDYDLGFFDEETTRLEPIGNPFEAQVLVVSMDQRNTSANLSLGGFRYETRTSRDNHRCAARGTLASI
jgi:hypothetical protein